MFTKTGNERSLIIISIGTYFLVAIIYLALGAPPSGDEPHYLLISETLIKYHSLDVLKAYVHKDYLSFYPRTMHSHLAVVQGRIVSVHQPGGPILWLLPFLLFGRLGAIWFMATVSVFIILNVYRFLLAMEILQPIAFKVSLILALASPLCIYAHMNFVEPIGALICIYVLRKFIENDVSLRVLLLSSLLLGLLPWVNVRFILIEVPLFFLLLWQIYQRYHSGNMLSYIAYFLPLALLTLGLEIFSWLFLGSLNPAIAQIAFHQSKTFMLSPFGPLFGLLFDQDSGLLICFPLSAFLLAGLLLSVKKRSLTHNMAILFTWVPYVIALSMYPSWHGGEWSPPARYVSVLLPVWSFYLACVLQYVKGRFVKQFVTISFWWGAVYNLWSLFPPTYGFVDPNQPNVVVASRLHIENFYLTALWPSVPDAEANWNVAKNYHVISICNVIWIVAYLLLTFFLLYHARSNSGERGKVTKLDHTAFYHQA